ncbi:hypothetical protein [Candidatus Protochlamydia phocaeensis]|uniref:hypothetical protein n=1 Tax=Candidatus Protochlamydia phocaeensis TaxID=1414722 RepID=UPI000838EC42|nr:hypothetical protein [Candidatus Protochlamydia phocaeensis]
MGLERPSFFESIMMSAAYARIDTKLGEKKPKDLSLRQKITNLVDTILAKLSSSYANRRTEIAHLVMQEHAQKHYPVIKAANDILKPTPSSPINPPPVISQEPPVVENEKQSSETEQLFEEKEGDLGTIAKEEKSQDPIEQTLSQPAQETDAVVDLEEKKVEEKKTEEEPIPLPPVVEHKDLPPPPSDKELEALAETEKKAAAPHPAPLYLQKEEKITVIEETPDHIIIDIPDIPITEEEIMEIMEDIWSFDQEKLEETDRYKMKQFVEYLYENPGAYLALIVGLQYRLALIQQLQELLPEAANELDLVEGKLENILKDAEGLDEEGIDMQRLFQEGAEDTEIEEAADNKEEVRQQEEMLKEEALQKDEQKPAGMMAQAQNFLSSLSNYLGVFSGFASIFQAEANVGKLPKEEQTEGRLAQEIGKIDEDLRQIL